MSAVVGIDLSSHAIDLVKLDENTNQAEWVRCELTGANAWERTLDIRRVLPWHPVYKSRNFWDDVYLVAIEAPYGRGQAGTSAILNRVVGAVAASLPAKLRCPERCWIVRPDEWQQGLGLKGKPDWPELKSLAYDWQIDVGWKHDQAMLPDALWQNARDAYCLALWARDTNAGAIAQSLARVAAGTQENKA